MDLTVQGLNDIRCVGDRADLDRKVEKSRQVVPVALPALHGIAILRAPLLFEVSQCRGRLLVVDRCIEHLHVSRELLHILPYHIATRVADLVNHADLGGSLRENSPDSIRKTVQVVRYGDQHILHAPDFQVGQNRKPE